MKEKKKAFQTLTCLKLERACSCHCWQNAAEKILATSPVGYQMKQLLEESVRWRWWRSWWWLWPDGGRRVGDVCNGIGGKKQPGHPRCTFLEQPPTNPCCCTTCSCSCNKPLQKTSQQLLQRELQQLLQFKATLHSDQIQPLQPLLLHHQLLQAQASAKKQYYENNTNQ